MQAPQRFDAQHVGELFPLNESRRLRAKPASPTQEKRRLTGRGGEILLKQPEAPAPPQQRTGNAQQCRRRKALMRNTAASCFPFNESCATFMLLSSLLRTQE